MHRVMKATKRTLDGGKGCRVTMTLACGCTVRRNYMVSSGKGARDCTPLTRAWCDVHTESCCSDPTPAVHADGQRLLPSV
jgi:hypothetical protein